MSAPAAGDRVVDGEYRALPDPVSDRIFDVLMCLAAEVWTVRDRLRLAETALAEHGIDIGAAIDGVRDRPAALAAMTAERDVFIARLLRPLRVQAGPSQ